MISFKWLLLIPLSCSSIYCIISHREKTGMVSNREVIVQLFEWRWLDIANECEKFLAPNGYGAVQISPPSENLKMYLDDNTRPWYERYQVMSYKIGTRSGHEGHFLEMTTRCNKVGVRIYADVVLNHMTSDYAMNGGTAGSTADFVNYNYPAVPYSWEDFHYPHCSIVDYNNVKEVRNCMMMKLKDLNQSMPYVRSNIVNYLNKLVSLGVGGFRVDAAKYMWPKDLKAIFDNVQNLNTRFGFPYNTRPYIYQEVTRGGASVASDYISIGDVTEFTGVLLLKDVFRGSKHLRVLRAWGSDKMNMLPSQNALVFVDNHDTQRYGRSLSYRDGPRYKAALAFLLAYQYGVQRIMSSYFFKNPDQGPPSDRNNTIKGPLNQDGTNCNPEWVCEHRWETTARMIKFKSVVHGTKVNKWWDNGENQIAFSRGHKGFIAFNLSKEAMFTLLPTSLPEGIYCDIKSGHTVGDTCFGKVVRVTSLGFAEVIITGREDDLYVAIHIGPESRLERM